MRNVTITTKGTKMTIVVDTSKDFGLSKSGKTVSIASTQGNKQVEESGVFVGLNVYKYPEE